MDPLDHAGVVGRPPRQGGLRAGAQMISYEIVLGLAAAFPVLRPSKWWAAALLAGGRVGIVLPDPGYHAAVREINTRLPSGVNLTRLAPLTPALIDWASFSLTSDAPGFFSRYWFGHYPWEDPQGFWARSPLSLVGNVQTPTLVVVGSEDYRTPVSEAEQLYAALKLIDRGSRWRLHVCMTATDAVARGRGGWHHDGVDYLLAQVNIARMREPLESPLLADFVAALDPVNALASSLFLCEPPMSRTTSASTVS